jgi:hypothetical protein
MAACEDGEKAHSNEDAQTSQPSNTQTTRGVAPEYIASDTLEDMVITKVLFVTDARAKFAACAKKFSRLKKFQKLEYNGLGIERCRSASSLR